MIGSRSCSSHVELGNDNRLRPLASDPSVGGSWVARHGKSELHSLLYARQQANDDPWRCVVFVLNRVAWVG